MSVSLLEVLENAGYDIKNNVDDARWFCSQADEFEELLEVAESVVEDYEEKERSEDYDD